MHKYTDLVWDLAEMLWRQEFHPYPPLGAFRDTDKVQQEVYLAFAGRVAGQLKDTHWIQLGGNDADQENRGKG